MSVFVCFWFPCLLIGTLPTPDDALSNIPTTRAFNPKRAKTQNITVGEYPPLHKRHIVGRDNTLVLGYIPNEIRHLCFAKQAYPSVPLEN